MPFVPKNYVDFLASNPITAAWANGVDVTVNSALAGATTPLQALTALGLGIPIPVAAGGTNAITPAQALINLGGVTGAQVASQITTTVNATYIGGQLTPQTPAEAAAGVPIAANLQYLQPGDFRRYGGDGTGVADSTAAINKAVSVVQVSFAATGLTFKTTGNHSPVAGASVVGPGTISLSGGTNYIFNIVNSNILINRLQMNGTAAVGLNKGAVLTTGTNMANVEVSDCFITSGRLVEFGVNCTNIRFLRNVITGPCVGSISGAVVNLGAGTACTNFQANDNFIVNTDGQGIGVFNQSTGGVISRNICSQNVGAGINIQNGRNMAIVGNICSGNGQVGIGHYSSGGVASQRNFICGNICVGNGFDGFDLVQSGTQYCYLDVTGNYAEANGTPINGGTGFNITYTSLSSFTGNIAFANSTYGFNVQGGTLNSFAGNQAISNGSNIPGTYSGFYLNGATNCTFIGNIATNTSGGPNQPWGIQEVGSANGNIISGNNCTNNAVGTVTTVGGLTIVRDDIGGYIDQSFVLTISNNGGTIQHSIYAQTGATILGNYSTRIANATASATNTPTGADASTPMLGGGKIGSGSTNNFWFDTANQIVVQADLMVSMVYNDTAAAVFVRPQIVSNTINGVFQNRLTFQFFTSAGVFALTTANIPAGKTMQIQFKGRLN